ncbi:MAG: hypothetical protein ACYS29_13450 [Planctomycetota bacterium]
MISGNYAYYGGGLRSCGSQITNCTISNNIAKHHGGGITCS